MKNKKALMVMLCAVLLVLSAVLGTLAYFTDAEKVTNTFTVGQVHIDLNETDVDGDKDTKANAYHLLPGHSYQKDPTVTVLKGSSDCYVRMIVTINMSEQWDAICDRLDVGAADIFTGLSDDWVLEGHPAEDTTANTRTYEFRYKNKVTGISETLDKPLEPLFTGLKMPDLLTNDDLASLDDDFQIDVVAHAIQAAGFDNADQAWAAFEVQH